MLPFPMLLRLARKLHAVWTERVEPATEPWRAWRALDAQFAERRLRGAAHGEHAHGSELCEQGFQHVEDSEVVTMSLSSWEPGGPETIRSMFEGSA